MAIGELSCGVIDTFNWTCDHPQAMDLAVYCVKHFVQLAEVERMEITLSGDQESFVKQGIETGRFKSEAQAVELAFDSLRAEDIILGNYSREQFNAILDEGLGDFEEGRFESLTHEVFERVKQEGRERLRKAQSGR